MLVFGGNNPLIQTIDPKFLEHPSRQDPLKDCLVGGWTTHRKTISQIGSSPQVGVNKKKFNWTPPAETMKSSGDMLLQLLYLTYLKKPMILPETTVFKKQSQTKQLVYLVGGFNPFEQY